MNYFRVRLSHGFVSSSRHGDPALLGVTPQALVLNTGENEPRITLLASEVVAIAKIPLTRRLEIRHVAFEKIGTVEIEAIDETPDLLLQRIRCIGFVPRAEEVLEWDPAQGPPPAADAPPAKQDDGTQQHE